MTQSTSILLTGGSGRLGTELRRLLPDLVAPPSDEMDITDAESVQAAIARYRPQAVIHAAAYTDVRGAEVERELCWKTNVDGTRNIARIASTAGAFLVHISTDYVFDGRSGNYQEDDSLGSALNYYALSKLVAEELARFSTRHLVIRTSFRPREWPYQTAFTDVFTSQDYVDVIAPKVALAIRNLRRIPFQTLHIGTERKSAFDLAKRRKSDVRAALSAEANVQIPADCSLDISRWVDLEANFRATFE